MPSLLATSGIEAPAASSASAWRSLRTICSGVWRFFIESPPSIHLGRSDSHSSWISFREQVTKPRASSKKWQPGYREAIAVETILLFLSLGPVGCVQSPGHLEALLPLQGIFVSDRAQIHFAHRC